MVVPFDIGTIYRANRVKIRVASATRARIIFFGALAKDLPFFAAVYRALLFWVFDSTSNTIG